MNRFSHPRRKRVWIVLVVKLTMKLMPPPRWELQVCFLLLLLLLLLCFLASQMLKVTDCFLNYVHLPHWVHCYVKLRSTVHYVVRLAHSVPALNITCKKIECLIFRWFFFSFRTNFQQKTFIHFADACQSKCTSTKHELTDKISVPWRVYRYSDERIS